MKNRLLITNLALFLAADIAVTSYILNKVNKPSNEIAIFNNPTITTEIYTPQPTEDIIVVETTEPPVEETQKEEIVIEEEKITQEGGKVTTYTTLYAYPNESALDITNLCVSDNVYKILSDASGYDLVRTDANQFGFIKNENVSYTDEKVEVPYIVNRKNDIVITTTGLNFRYGPSTEYESFRLLDPETELQVLGETEDDWLLVHLNGEIGFVKKDYTTSVLDIIKEKYPELDYNNLEVQKVVKVRDGINYRRGPSTDDAKQ